MGREDRMAAGYVIFMFAVGLVLLIWGSDLFVESAVSLAEHFHISEVVIGATVVSLGTTLPEVLFSTTAAMNKMPDMALGNAMGSILCNTGFIAGTMLLLSPIRLNEEAVHNLTSGTFFLVSGFLVYVGSGLCLGGLTRGTGMLLLGIFALFIYNTVKEGAGQQAAALDRKGPVSAFGCSDVLRLLLEMAAIYTGADLLVQYGPRLARTLGVPELVISLTFVALGTSLPELVTSLAAWRKAHSALSLGNIIGADILNFVLVGGASSVICPVPYPDSILHLELPFIMLLLSVLCIPSLSRRKAVRIQGVLLLAGYGVYLFCMMAYGG